VEIAGETDFYSLDLTDQANHEILATNSFNPISTNRKLGGEKYQNMTIKLKDF
jgi:hypothetical protein